MQTKPSILKPRGRIRGGAKVPHRKNTAEQPTAVMTGIERVEIPVSQHIGAPCRPTVAKGDYVGVGQLIADSDNPMSAPIHSSVSGTVAGFGSVIMPNGNRLDTVIIDSDGEMKPFEGIKPPVYSTREEFIACVRRSGLVGLGGAGFPTSVKLNIPEGRKVDTLIINAAECEPYITSDYRECIESAELIMGGVYRLRKILEVDRVIICVEDNKPKAIEILAEIAAADDDYDDAVRLMKLKSRYPQGAEKVIVYSATGRVIPAGALPLDVGCVVMNVTSVAFIEKYFRTGMPLVSKRITVDGSAVANPQNVIVPIGVSVGDVIEFCGGFKSEPRKLLMGGPMMGLALCELSMPVIKNNNAVLAFAEDGAPPEASACIRCGKCVSVCPMNLMPVGIAEALKADDVRRLDRLSVMSCMECGSCAFACPANRPLVQTMRLAKQKVRGAKK